MKINLYSTLAGPAGSRDPGIQDIPDDEGQALIDAGYAEEVEAVPQSNNADSPFEGQATRPPTSYATLPQPRKPRKAPPAPKE